MRIVRQQVSPYYRGFCDSPWPFVLSRLNDHWLEDVDLELSQMVLSHAVRAIAVRHIVDGFDFAAV